jgi:hypothetical protein
MTFTLQLGGEIMNGLPDIVIGFRRNAYRTPRAWRRAPARV